LLLPNTFFGDIAKQSNGCFHQHLPGTGHLFSHSTATVMDNQGPVINNAHVELVFWGTGWNANQASANSIWSAVSGMLASPYLSALKQYRASIGSASLAGSPAFITDSSPSSSFIGTDVDHMLKAEMANGHLPAPSSDSQLLYMVGLQARPRARVRVSAREVFTKLALIAPSR